MVGRTIQYLIDGSEESFKLDNITTFVNDLP